MISIHKQQLHELFIYSALWLFVFIAPPIDIYLKASNDSSLTFRWADAYGMWCSMLFFFILFLVHNFLLAPRLLLTGKTALYICSLVFVLAVFQLLQEVGHPFYDRRPYFPQQSFRQNVQRFDVPEASFPPLKNKKPMMEGHSFQGGRKFPGPNFFIFNPNTIRLIIALLMLGFNIGVKLLFKSQRDEEVLQELERHNLQQELEYLKYQINPHFFMNTLNNIHALVDIDAAKAKNTILELSRLMRYVLYEGSNRTILLSREIEFLNHYIALMSLRYTNKVTITTDFTTEVPEVQIPPLLFISFVENAFKHGVSYLSSSFIRLSLIIEGNELFFRCANSNSAKNDNSHSGIGLENVRKRLKLLYGNDYYLNIEAAPETYEILLVIPVTA